MRFMFPATPRRPPLFLVKGEPHVTPMGIPEAGHLGYLVAAELVDSSGFCESIQVGRGDRP